MGDDLLVIAASSGENLRLAERLVALASERGLGASILDLTRVPLPLFTPARKAEGLPEAIGELSTRLGGSPRWLICAPEYNGSIPPVLSNAIAWLSVADPDFRRLFNGRPVAIASHSGSGGYGVLAALRLQLAHLGAHVVGRQVIATRTRPAEDASLADLVDRLRQLEPITIA